MAIFHGQQQTTIMNAVKDLRPAKAKSVTFTGCWTCRSRKVKCDERQESGCGVCEKTGLECEGYGVNLCWVTGEKQNFQGLRRRAMKPCQPSSPGLSDDEIGGILTTLDTILTPPDTVAMGPFAVFDAQSDKYKATTASRPKVDLLDEDPDVLHVERQPSPSLELSMPIFNDPQTWMLMSHYMNHVADLLQPVLHPQNPWRTTYFPFALEGCPDLFLAQNSTTPSHASIALFHSLLSSAAFHLRNATNGSREFHNLGLQHRINALQALNAVPIHASNSQQYTVCLTAILSLVTIDTMTGEDSDFLIHLTGCHRLRKPLHGSTIITDSNIQVNSIFHFLTLLALTTSELGPRDWQGENPSFDLPHFRSDERSIEHIYGITPTLGNLLHRICQLAQHLAFYEGHGKTPVILEEACQTLGEDICSWGIESEPFYMIEAEGTMLEIALCQARAFKSAVLVFYYRMIIGSCPLNMEKDIQSIWQSLNHAENLKDEYMGGDKRTAPMSWPAFVAACEARDRQRWVQWWTRVQTYRIGNLMRQWGVIQEIWTMMDADTNLNWRDALRQTGKLILPI